MKREISYTLQSKWTESNCKFLGGCAQFAQGKIAYIIVPKSMHYIENSSGLIIANTCTILPTTVIFDLVTE